MSFGFVLIGVVVLYVLAMVWIVKTHERGCGDEGQKM
jgi:hypothetical protein